jgi:hypothetical protein
MISVAVLGLEETLISGDAPVTQDVVLGLEVVLAESCEGPRLLALLLPSLEGTRVETSLTPLEHLPWLAPADFVVHSRKAAAATSSGRHGRVVHEVLARPWLASRCRWTDKNELLEELAGEGVADRRSGKATELGGRARRAASS